MTFPSARLLRDALVQALITPHGAAPPDAVLVAFDENQCVLKLRQDGAELHILTHGAGTPVGAMLQPLKDIVAASKKAPVLRLMVVSGDREVRGVLSKATPFFQLSRRIIIHHVNLDGEVYTAPTLIGDPVKAALKRLEQKTPEDLSPMGAQALEEARAAAAEQQRQMHAFSASLAQVTPWATYALGALLLLLFFGETAWGGSETALTLLKMGANKGTRFLNGDWWRPLSSAFLHIGVVHLLFNLWALTIFGQFFERLVGHSRFLLLYGLSALGGGLCSALMHPESISAGASGALWGLMTGTMALTLRPRGWVNPVAAGSMKSTAWQPVLVNVLYSFKPGVDLWAHLGGGVVGFLIVFFPLIARQRKDGEARPTSPGCAGFAAVMTLSMLLCVGTALAVGRPWEMVRPPPMVRVPVGVLGLTVELPSSLAAERHEAPARDTVHEVSFGSLENDPVTVSVVAQRLSDSADSHAILLELSKEISEHPTQGAARAVPVTLETWAGREVVFSDEQFENKVRCPRFLTVLDGNLLVVIQVFSYPSTAPAWMELEKQYVTHVQLEAQP